MCIQRLYYTVSYHTLRIPTRSGWCFHFVRKMTKHVHPFGRSSPIRLGWNPPSRSVAVTISRQGSTMTSGVRNLAFTHPVASGVPWTTGDATPRINSRYSRLPEWLNDLTWFQNVSKICGYLCLSLFIYISLSIYCTYTIIHMRRCVHRIFT